MVDGAVIGQPSSDMKFKLITLASGLQGRAKPTPNWLLQSRADDAVIVLLNSSESDYYQEFEEARRIEKYIKQRNIAQLTESIRKIVQGETGRGQGAGEDRRKSPEGRHSTGVTFFISGERVQIRAVPR